MGFSGVIGVEPSTAPINAAKPEVRPFLRHQSFCDDDFASSSATLVSCFQVLEHVSAPVSVVSTAFRVLKPKGLFLAVVHNQRALSARILGMKSPIYDIEHLQLFNKASARKLLERAGFEGIRVYPLWNRYPLRYWFRLFPFPDSIKGGLMSFAKSSSIGNVKISCPAGNLVLIGFKGRGGR
jgi:SAM-dependent methyltransferase